MRRPTDAEAEAFFNKPEVRAAFERYEARRAAGIQETPDPPDWIQQRYARIWAEHLVPN